MIIGIDFDNTIISYKHVFVRVAQEQGLLAQDYPLETSKTELRDFFRQSGREDQWTKLQGFVYGKCLGQAKIFEDVRSFFIRSQKENATTYIISHKTRHPYQGPRYDLHEAARTWLQDQDFFSPDGLNLKPAALFFEESAEAKSKRIHDLKCDYFIDDLPEFLSRQDFPPHTKPLLFDPYEDHKDFENRKDQTIERLCSWKKVEAYCFENEVS